MTPVNTHKPDMPEFPGKLRGVPTLYFSLALILASLSPVFSEAPVFAGITVFVLGLLIFSYARNFVTVLGILAPCLFLIATTGNLSVASIYIGCIFGFGASAWLTMGKGFPRVVIPVLSSYIAAAIVLGPLEAIPTLVPAALGILAVPLLRRRQLSETLGLMTFLILSGALILFIAMGGDLSESAELMRTYITDLYKSAGEGLIVIEERYVDMLAAYFVNLLPGCIFAAASAFCYLSVSLTNALFDSSSEAEIPENMRTLSLSPVSGIVYIACFLLSAAFAAEGNDYEMAGAVTENIMLALSLPFIIMGCGAVTSFFSRKERRFGERCPRFAVIAIAILFATSTSIAAAVFTALGISESVKPLTVGIIRKFTRTENKENKK